MQFFGVRSVPDSRVTPSTLVGNVSYGEIS
jgi:hypothetical protein